MMHSQPTMRADADRKRSEVEQRNAELRKILDDTGSEASQIKAALDALRNAKEKAGRELAEARKSLCQFMMVRQEAVLVLNGLLA